jgi:hypothetical protein
MFFRRVALLVVFALITLSSPARAEGEYSDPTWTNLVRAMIRFGAMDLAEEKLIDDYAKISECSLYENFYDDDFKWTDVRQAIRKSVQMNIASFPVAFHYEAKVPLGRYDMEAKVFRFARKGVVDGVNVITLHAANTNCPNADVFYLPKVFKAYLTSTIYIDGIPMSEDDAKALIKHLEDAQNTRRIVIAKYNLRIVYVDPFVKIEAKSKKSRTAYVQTENDKKGDMARFNARLDSIEFFEDALMTKPIALVKP